MCFITCKAHYYYLNVYLNCVHSTEKSQTLVFDQFSFLIALILPDLDCLY